jgi:Flp pilus assembly pilin Flp
MKALLRTATLKLRRRTRQKGQTLVEYVLIMAVMTVIAIGVFSLLSYRITVIFSRIANILDTAQSS